VPGPDELVIDLTNYKDRVGTRVVPGRYRVQVEDVESTESSNKNPMVNLWFRVLGGEFDGATITDRLVLTEKSLFRVVGFMGGIGLPTPRRKLRLNVRLFVGRTLEIEVDDGDPYNGRVRSEVRAYYKVPKDESDGDTSGDEEDPPANVPPAPASDGLDEFAPETSQNPGEQVSVDLSDQVDLDSVEL
jgi:hypothetical protein